MMVHDYFLLKAFDRTHAIYIVFQCRGFYDVPFLISDCYYCLMTNSFVDSPFEFAII